MKKTYKNRQIETEKGSETAKERLYMFPSVPVTIKATSRQEAEEKLKSKIKK